MMTIIFYLAGIFIGTISGRLWERNEKLSSCLAIGFYSILMGLVLLDLFKE